jgi:CelD/BcsL family acetyltransferase involved in cellulose biosynthesis
MLEFKFHAVGRGFIGVEGQGKKKGGADGVNSQEFINANTEVGVLDDTSDKTTFSLYEGQEGLARLRDLWARLTHTMGDRRFFHMHGWYASYLNCLDAGDGTVFFVAAFRGSEPVAIFPLKSARRRYCGVPVRYIEIPTHAHMNLSDFVFRHTEANAGLVRGLIQNLKRITGKSWDLLHVPNVLGSSAAAFSLQRTPVPLTVWAHASLSDFVETDQPFERVAEQFKNSFRKQLRVWGRKAAARGVIEYEYYFSVDDIHRHFGRFLEVEASGWKGEKGTRTAIACDPTLVAFYRKLIDEFGLSGQCLLSLATLNGRCIAGQFCLNVGGVVDMLKIGFDETCADFSPGNLIRQDLIREQANDNATRAVSFVTHNSRTNSQWGAKTADVLTIDVFNHFTPVGWLGYCVCTSKNVLKRALPASLKARLVSFLQNPGKPAPGGSAGSSP